MDEHELETLFRAAPGEPPPPGFTLTDVTRASVRVSARRRSNLFVAAACLIAVLGAGTIAGLTHFRGTSPTTAQPAAAPTRPSQAFPAPSPLQGSGGTGEDGTRADSTPGCEKVDRELATALAGELPATGATGPSPGRLCPTAARSAGFRVTDGDRTGVVSVTLFPAGVPVQIPPMTDGTVLTNRPAAGGGTIAVLSTPDARSAPPFEGSLPAVATALGQRF
jgi:hypothetical protein